MYNEVERREDWNQEKRKDRKRRSHTGLEKSGAMGMKRKNKKREGKRK